MHVVPATILLLSRSLSLRHSPPLCTSAPLLTSLSPPPLFNSRHTGLLHLRQCLTQKPTFSLAYLTQTPNSRQLNSHLTSTHPRIYASSIEQPTMNNQQRTTLSYIA